MIRKYIASQYNVKFCYILIVIVFFCFISRTTADEHLIELNLQKPINLGHVDFKFSLYSQSSNVPAIQVTLLKQKTNGFGCRLRGNNIQKDDENMYKSETSSQSANNSKGN